MISTLTLCYDVIVIGAGAEGVGVSVALKHAGIENFCLPDRYHVGASFERWPAETRLITPSFPTNSIGILDLNSVAIGVSQVFSLEVEHPTSQEYASHLKGVAEFFELPIQNSSHVLHITKVADGFRIESAKVALQAKHVIWAAGEFQYPRTAAFPRSELFERRKDGFPLLSSNDESTIVPRVFLCGPAVRHDNHVFCFIYKYRQRFAVVAKAIATSLGLPAEELETYRKWGMYLDDLSCCGEDCVC
jgi:hypothetical protein